MFGPDNPIHLPADYGENFKVQRAKVVSVGKDAALEGIESDMIVLYDKHATFSANSVGSDKVGELVITRIENIIAIVEEN